MLISHESPISMLEISKTYNDYDYALVHLFETEPEYLKFFEESIKTRIMYLDNSLYELGESFDADKFKDYCDHFANINEDNFYYIVPDAFEDYNKTINQFKNFPKCKGKRIGVVQGSTFNELIDCYRFMQDNCDVVAFSFGNPFYKEYCDLPTRTIEEKYMLGRVNFIRFLKDNNYFDNTKIHLLGCYLPQEFKYYKDIPEIISIDTSNPVVHGIKNIRYTNAGLLTKEKTKLVDLLYYDGPTDLILDNIKLFRFINNI